MPERPFMTNVFLSLVGGLVVYELVALRTKCAGDTISEIIWTATKRRAILPFAAGVLCGHFFWQRVADDDGGRSDTAA